MRRTLARAVAEASQMLNVEQALKAPKPTLKRRTWTRYHHELLNMPLWRRVARLSGASLERVEAMVNRLEVHASESKPTGYVEDFDLEALSAHWNLPTAEGVARVYAALEEVGWIDQGQIATFWSRNPDEEGEELERRRAADNARQQKRRARVRAEKEASRQALGYPRSRDRHVTSVTVTARADQKHTDKSECDTQPDLLGETDPSGKSGKSGEIATPELWLKLAGQRFVTEAGNVQPVRAEQLIARWSRDIGSEALAHLLVNTERAGHVTGEKLVEFVGREVARVQGEQEQGRQLGLMPPRPARRGAA